MSNLSGAQLSYSELRTISPEAARQAVCSIYQSLDGDVSHTARLLHTTRPTVYLALKKKAQKSLGDISRAPHQVANKTRRDIEEKVIVLKEKINYGPERLAAELKLQHNITLPVSTIRNIVKRNKDTIKKKQVKRHKNTPREFIDWYSAKAGEIVQIDVKYIVDQKALSLDQIHHITLKDLPLYQFGALDVTSRFKLMGYAKERTWTNGLTWFLWVLSWYRSHGYKGILTFTVDHGIEFGGDCWYKVADLKKLLSGFGVKLIQNHKKCPQENAHIERSHRTDDEEFYMPRIHKIDTNHEFYTEALNYLYYYNCVRLHAGIQKQTPFSVLKRDIPHIDDTIKYVPPIYLDKLSVDLGPWSGYHVLASYHSSMSINNVIGIDMMHSTIQRNDSVSR